MLRFPSRVLLLWIAELVAVDDGNVPPRPSCRASDAVQTCPVQFGFHGCLPAFSPEGFLADFSRNEMRNTTALSQSDDDWETWADVSVEAVKVQSRTVARSHESI